MHPSTSLTDRNRASTRQENNTNDDHRSPTAITVYSKLACGQCTSPTKPSTSTATYKAFDKHRIAYTAVDNTQDDTARQYVPALGYLAASVVVAGNEHWAGFCSDRIRQLSTSPRSAVEQSA